ncbi:1,4-beta-xylanase [Gorillibacterium sp. CAU 1737]|uniref:glycoside hydrolase family 113 n=1 Tax=Gorillibacterium sp. CAU 1737 TaxID=3140362 RepID=UPI0032619CAB
MNNPLHGYKAGMTWGWTGTRGTWATEEAMHSMEIMADKLALNWVTIAFAALQDHPQSTQIDFENAPTVTDDEVKNAIRKAKELGLQVCLKPVVNVRNGTWRAHIRFFDRDVPCEPKWSDWFQSYTRFIVHHARIAEETGCELFCIGCEMVSTDHREAEWRQLIAEVRKVYSGPITYNCDKYQEDHVSWWDAVDVISSSGYYPVDAWEENLDRIEAVVQAHGKPFFFIEAGCMSQEGSEFLPNDWSLKGTPSQEAQDAFYRAMFTACDKRPWVEGFMLWDWPALLPSAEAAPHTGGYYVYGKKAEETIQTYYREKLQNS